MRKNLPNPLSLRFVVPWQSFKYRAKNDAILFHGRVAGRMGRTAIVTSTREHRSFASHVFLVCCREKVSYLKVKLPEMPSRCVVGGCSNTPDLERGIALHTIPFHRYERPMAKKRRKRWVDFIKTKRAKWEPSKTSAICSAHFLPGDFQRLFSNLPGQTKAVIPRLNRDDLGVTVFPTIHPSTGTVSEPQSKRSRRKVRFECISCCIANRVNSWHVFIIFLPDLTRGDGCWGNFDRVPILQCGLGHGSRASGRVFSPKCSRARSGRKCCCDRRAHEDHTEQEVTDFISGANNVHPTIKFTAEISQNNTTFLDTTVYKGDRFAKESILDVRTHFKPTETFQYTHYRSCHPPGVVKGFICSPIFWSCLPILLFSLRPIFVRG